MNYRFSDFGRLYRAAYAEVDPEKKMLLLSAVQRAIEEWRSMAEKESPAQILVSSGTVLASLPYPKQVAQDRETTDPWKLRGALISSPRTILRTS